MSTTRPPNASVLHALRLREVEGVPLVAPMTHFRDTELGRPEHILTRVPMHTGWSLLPSAAYNNFIARFGLWHLSSNVWLVAHLSRLQHPAVFNTARWFFLFFRTSVTPGHRTIVNAFFLAKAYGRDPFHVLAALFDEDEPAVRQAFLAFGVSARARVPRLVEHIASTQLVWATPELFPSRVTRPSPVLLFSLHHYLPPHGVVLAPLHLAPTLGTAHALHIASSVHATPEDGRPSVLIVYHVCLAEVRLVVMPSPWDLLRPGVLLEPGVLLTLERCLPTGPNQQFFFDPTNTILGSWVDIHWVCFVSVSPRGLSAVLHPASLPVSFPGAPLLPHVHPASL